MIRNKIKKPEFYRDFMSEGFFANANKIIKYQESSNYWIFKTGKKVYKIKKKTTAQNAIALDEIFCKEIVSSQIQHSPELETELLFIREENGRFVVDRDNKKTPRYCGIVMNQLTERYFLDVIIGKKKVTKKMIALTAEFLLRLHKLTPVATFKEEGTPEQLHSILQDLIYQSKKYLGQTMSQAVIDMILRPLEKFLTDHRKLFLKRIRKGYVKKVHGCFIPKKINIHKGSVNVLSRSSDQLKNRFSDVASDVADLVVELNQADQKELADFLAKTYSHIGGDKEIKQLLPFYRAMRCLNLGNKHSVTMRSSSKQQALIHQSRAKKYYEQIIDIVHKL